MRDAMEHPGPRLAVEPVSVDADFGFAAKVLEH